MIVLGTVVTDSITGFKGMAVSRTEFQHSCVRIRVQPTTLTADGKIPDDVVLDELQLKENDPSTTPDLSELLGTGDTDVVTGISGTIVSRTTYMFAGPRVFIQPKGMSEEGKSLEGVVVDEPQLKSRNTLKAKLQAKLQRPSGPGDIARPHSIATR